MNKNKWIIVGLIIALIASVLVACTIGAMHVSLPKIVHIVLVKTGIFFPTSVSVSFNQQEEAVIWLVRLPRVLTSIFVGASLALSGTAMQGLFRNPLADPSIIGISGGSSLAAAICIIALPASIGAQHFLGLSTISVGAFAGAVATAVLIFSIAKEKRKTNVANMLLAGIAINALAGACTGLLIYLSTDEQLRSLTFWSLGSLGGANWKTAIMMTLVTLVSLSVFMKYKKDFNALSLGEQEAEYLGIRTEQLKRVVILFTSLSVGTSVAFCGIIGFVGLVIPHLLRLTGSSDHRFLIPASALGGALLLCLADVMSRTIVAPAEVPIGIITALTGAPVFLYLLIRQKKKTTIVC